VLGKANSRIRPDWFLPPELTIALIHETPRLRYCQEPRPSTQPADQLKKLSRKTGSRLTRLHVLYARGIPPGYPICASMTPAHQVPPRTVTAAKEIQRKHVRSVKTPYLRFHPVPGSQDLSTTGRSRAPRKLHCLPQLTHLRDATTDRLNYSRSTSHKIPTCLADQHWMYWAFITKTT